MHTHQPWGACRDYSLLNDRPKRGSRRAREGETPDEDPGSHRRIPRGERRGPFRRPTRRPGCRGGARPDHDRRAGRRFSHRASQTAAAERHPRRRLRDPAKLRRVREMRASEPQNAPGNPGGDLDPGRSNSRRPGGRRKRRPRHVERMGGRRGCAATDLRGETSGRRRSPHAPAKAVLGGERDKIEPATPA